MKDDHEPEVTPDELARLLEDQGGCCAICFADDRDDWHLDHDDSGAFRGVLCCDCFHALWGFMADIVYMTDAIRYVAIHDAVKARAAKPDETPPPKSTDPRGN